MPHPVALDDVAGPDVVREDHRLVADGAARLLHLADRPDAVGLDRTEGDAGAVRAIEYLTATDPGRDLDLLTSARTPHRSHPGPLQRDTQQPLEPPAIEAYDDLVVDPRHRRRSISHPDQLVAGRCIRADVLGRERDPFLRKKLFLVLAGRSARLRVDDYL